MVGNIAWFPLTMFFGAVHLISVVAPSLADARCASTDENIAISGLFSACAPA